MSDNPLVVGKISFGNIVVKKLRPIKPTVDGNLDKISEVGSTPTSATKSEKEIREALDLVESFVKRFKGQELDEELARLLDVQVGKTYALKWVLGEQEKI
jgi:hypothetical protein